LEEEDEKRGGFYTGSKKERKEKKEKGYNSRSIRKRKKK